MQKKEITLVFYHVPEDQDDPEAPNVFSIPVNRPALRLKHIHQYFPLKGTYAFRFKAAYQGFIVWLDVSDLESEVPFFKDRVYMKANRLSWEESAGYQQSQVSASNPTKYMKQAEPINLFDHHEQPSPAPQRPMQNGFGEMNLLEGHHGIPLNQGMNVDFFSEPVIEVKKQKNEVNLFGEYENHGDLI